jgi:threonyl-tRNA synthetase
MRVELDERNDVMKAKIRDFATAKVPFILIMGDKEAASGEVSVRVRGKGDEGGVPLEAFIERCVRLIAARAASLETVISV